MIASHIILCNALIWDNNRTLASSTGNHNLGQSFSIIKMENIPKDLTVTILPRVDDSENILTKIGINSYIVLEERYLYSCCRPQGRKIYS